MTALDTRHVRASVVELARGPRVTGPTKSAGATLRELMDRLGQISKRAKAELKRSGTQRARGKKKYS